jgi:glutathione S-transferase
MDAIRHGRKEQTMPELELIGDARSNFVWTCRMALTEKGVPYRLTSVMPHTPGVQAIHPLGKIPVMRHGAVALAESRAICGYVERAFDGPALIPADAAQAGAIEQWISIVNTSIDPVWMRQYFAAYVFPGTADGAPNRPVIEAALPKMEQQFSVMDRAVARTGYLAGEAFALADMYFTPVLYYMRWAPESAAMLAANAHLKSYLERNLARPCVQATIPPPMPGRSAGTRADGTEAA